MSNFKRRDEIRNEDITLSDAVYSILDQTFYPTQTTNFERVTDAIRQKQGVDVMFNIGDKHYIADEKAAVHYYNLKTFILELSFINRAGKLNSGWFLNEQNVNDSYVLTWIDKDEQTGKKSLTVAVVMADALHNYLDGLGWTREKLIRKITRIRSGEDTNMGNLYRNGCKFSYSPDKPEQPINILLPRDVYMKLADKTWTEEIN